MQRILHEGTLQQLITDLELEPVRFRGLEALKACGCELGAKGFNNFGSPLEPRIDIGYYGAHFENNPVVYALVLPRSPYINLAVPADLLSEGHEAGTYLLVEMQAAFAFERA